jgi:pimeloyl-ACP methyl ester carboxylesterase
MMTESSKPFLGVFRRLLVAAAVLMAIPVLLITGCQSRLIYYPRPYAPETKREWQSRHGGRFIDYQTGEGRQRAFLQGNLRSPRNLWIVCGGNGSLALDWSDWLAEHAPKEDAFLLVDFPGYGDCEGSPHPSRIRESFRKALPAAWTSLGQTPDPARMRFFGHSLGGAACLIGAADQGISRGVLLAPFTSTMDMAREVTGLPVGFLVWHRFDNRARLEDLQQRGASNVIILHGSNDEVIPVAMSRSLAATFPGNVRLVEINAGRHNTVQDSHPQLLGDALREAGR